MRSLQLRAHVDAQGTLLLALPPDLASQEVDLVVVFEPVTGVDAAVLPAETGGWPPGLFERTAGAWQGEPLRRESEGEYEERAPLE